ncbi:MAG: hypothetical protein GX605_06120 [Chloroflexi bacterium]|nr:hypothetical protein [Chloroflexota bacterium]
MALTIGGSTVAAPKAEDGCTEGRILVGSQERNLDGGMSEDLFAWKRTWTVHWALISDAQVSAIESAIAGTPPLAFGPLYGGSFYVMVRSFNKTPVYVRAGTVWNATLTVEEA